MPELLLGPILRHVEDECATVWVEADSDCEVTVNGECARETFHVEGHYYALVELRGLTPGEATPYTIELDGTHAWPPADYPYPAPVVRPHPAGEEIKLIFGSCRVSQPHEPPYVLHQDEHERGHGIDALRTLALCLIRNEEKIPDCLLMLGDQVYADDLSPAMLEITRSRTDLAGAPDDVLGDFEEYALAYREAWGEELIRWLLSTVPVAMIFDDHEIHAQWHISEGWQAKYEAHDWYEPHISAGLMAYWIYQHIGNLSFDEIQDHDLLDECYDADDAGELLRKEMLGADSQSSHSRWSYYRDVGNSRLIVIDSRAGRELKPPNRKIVNDDEWDWIVERTRGDFDHIMLASSVPMFLTPGLHFAEAWNTHLADGHRGKLATRFGEKVRQLGVIDHWASFPDSFERLCKLLGEIATGEAGEGGPPESIVLLGGDVHHCYLARVSLDTEPDCHSNIYQAVCSAYRKDLEPNQLRLMKVANSKRGERIARRMARMAGAPAPPASWEIVHEPNYDNQVASLYLKPDKALLRVETPHGSDWRNPDLHTVFEHDLLEGN